MSLCVCAAVNVVERSKRPLTASDSSSSGGSDSEEDDKTAAAPPATAVASETAITHSNKKADLKRFEMALS